MQETVRVPPVKWDSWEFVRKLGNGSFGTVYEIRQQVGNVHRSAALKVIPIPRDEAEIREMYASGYDEASIQKNLQAEMNDVLREFSVMLQLKGHTNIVYCDDLRCIPRESGFGWDVCLQMELLIPLLQVLGQSISEQQTLQIGMDLSNALLICKKDHIIHRDIKPQNIFVSKDGDYKLGDFGIARTMERTGNATMAGTFSYMAPEVKQGQRYGMSADIYSLGLVLYWLLNERHLPFVPIMDRPPTVGEQEEGLLRRFRGERIPCPVHGSESLKTFVCKMCSFLPDERPSIEEISVVLTRLKAGGDVAQFVQDDTFRIPVQDSEIDNSEDKPYAEKRLKLFQRPKTKRTTRNAPKQTIKKAWFGIAGVCLAILVLVIVFPQFSNERTARPADQLMSAQTTPQLDGATVAAANDEISGEVTILTTSTMLLEGDSILLRLKQGDWYIDGASHGLEWSSSDASVADVSDGVVMAVSEGTTTITGTRNQESGSLKLTVVSLDTNSGASIQANRENITLKKGSRETDTVTLILCGDVPEKYTACYYSSNYAVSPSWGETNGKILNLNVSASMLVDTKAEVTVLLFPKDEPEHVVAAKQIHVEVKK